MTKKLQLKDNTKLELIGKIIGKLDILTPIKNSNWYNDQFDLLYDKPITYLQVLLSLINKKS